MEKKSESLIMEAEQSIGHVEITVPVRGVQERESINTLDVQKQMRVYRLENKDGFGPYTLFWDRGADFPRRLLDILMGHNEDTVNHPNRSTDKKLWKQWKLNKYRIYEDWRFCFADMPSLRVWFDDETLHLLKDVGVNIVEYEVPKDYVMVGDKQALFKAEKAKKVLTSQD
jgi:hypothetical protein